MRKKYSAILLPLVCTVTLLAGCNGNQSAPTVSPASGSSATPAATQAVSQGYNGTDNLQVSESPVTITLFYAFTANGAPKGDMPVWAEAERITNVRMENVASESIAEEAQSFNSMLATGRLPDIIHGQRITINPVLDQGILIPLNELIEEHAPNIQRFLDEYPRARIAGTGSDGQIYTITGTLGGEPGKALPSMGYFIRQDWLDNLSLEVPTTLEAYKDVLYAFREQDPNGNQQQDEVPLFTRNQSTWSSLQLWGSTNTWYVAPDDTIKHGKAEPEFRDAIGELAIWYRDGILDQEFYTRGSQARQFLLGNDLGGSTIDWFASTAAINDSAREQVPGINFVAIAPPANSKGVVEFPHTRDAIHTFAWGISSHAADPVTVIKYMDFFFSDVGEVLTNFGVEGVHHDLVDGEPAMRDEALSFASGLPNYLRSIGGGYEIGRRGSLIGELSSMNEIGRAGFELYEQSDWLIEPDPIFTFTEAERRAIDDVMVNINAHMDEYEQKIVLGSENIDATWDNYITELYNMGLQQAIDAQNSAYQRYKEETGG